MDNLIFSLFTFMAMLGILVLLYLKTNNREVWEYTFHSQDLFVICGCVTGLIFLQLAMFQGSAFAVRENWGLLLTGSLLLAGEWIGFVVLPGPWSTRFWRKLSKIRRNRVVSTAIFRQWDHGKF